MGFLISFYVAHLVLLFFYCCDFMCFYAVFCVLCLLREALCNFVLISAILIKILLLLLLEEKNEPMSDCLAMPSDPACGADRILRHFCHHSSVQFFKNLSMYGFIMLYMVRT